jgi:pyridoxine 5-phosphate synthase
LRPLLTTEFNIEGNPTPKFIELVKAVKPHQVTLVPDAHDAITSNSGWDTVTHQDFLKDVVTDFQSVGIRVSIFVGTDLKHIEYAAKSGADRVELYTEPYASIYPKNREEALRPFLEAAKFARKIGLGLNAGHDLSLENLEYLHKNIPWIDEVSIGHALISDALYFGLEETIKRYKNQLK